MEHVGTNKVKLKLNVYLYGIGIKTTDKETRITLWKIWRQIPVTSLNKQEESSGSTGR